MTGLPVEKWRPALPYVDWRRTALGAFAAAWSAYLEARGGGDPVATVDALTSVYDTHIGIAAAGHYLDSVDRNGVPVWVTPDGDNPRPCGDCGTTESPSWQYSRHGERRWCVLCQFEQEMRQLDVCGRCDHRRFSHDPGHCWTCLCSEDLDEKRTNKHRFILAVPAVVAEPELALFDLAEVG